MTCKTKENRLQRKAKETAKERIKCLKIERKKKQNSHELTTQLCQETAGEWQETAASGSHGSNTHRMFINYWMYIIK